LKWSRKLYLSGSIALALASAAFLARAELAPYLQHIDAASRLESVFFKITGRRPPSETRPALTNLIASAPNDADLYSLRALEAERQLDFAAAEEDWRKYAELAADKFAGNTGLAGFYHRRLEPAKELAALHAAAMLPDPPLEQRSAKTFERILTLINDQLLGYDAARNEFRAWLERYPKESAPYSRFLDYAVEHKQYADAEQVLKQYIAAFPDDTVFPVRAQAQIEAARGSAQSALALYDRAFQPLWPPELVKSYFELLTRSGALRRYLESARSALAANPGDLSAAARVFYYWQQEGNLAAAQRPLFEYEARKTAWTADELFTLAKLYETANNPDRAARCYYAMYSLPGAAAPDAERSLAGLANLLFASAGQGIHFGSADLSYYRDIAQADPYPGYLNGVLSLLFNSTEPQYRYESETQTAQPYFHRARAAGLVALFDSRFPNSRRRAELHARLINALSLQGDSQAVIQAGRQFRTEFTNSTSRTEVATLMANAYARLNQTQAEFALYDELLAELAREAEGVPLGERAGAPQKQGGQPPQTPAQPRSPEYARILDRYIARLVALKRVPAAIALYRREIERNASDPGLYERFAAFLEQNKLGSDVEEIYRRAMAQFPRKDFSHKLARWYLRQKQTAQLSQLTQQVTQTFSGTELESYFAAVVPKANLAPALYRQLNLYAHQRFPHDLAFTRNLLAAYTTRGTADPVAYEALLRSNWFYADDLRMRFFEHLSRTRKLDAELAALGSITTPQQVNANPAAARMFAEGEAWRGHYEAAAPVFRVITASYPASSPNTQRAAAIYRSLATLDPKFTETSSDIEQNLVAFSPRSTEALTYAGEIWADGDNFGRARPLWNRIAAVAPGRSEGYLESATIFWDYFLYDDALRVINEGRTRLDKPALYAYEAGAIYENKRQYDRALAEYANAALNDASDLAQRRLVRLARRPDLRNDVERLTADIGNRTEPSIRAVELRAAVLDNQGRRADLEQFYIAAAGRTTSIETIDWIGNQGRIAGFAKVEERALQRRVEITNDPVDRIRYQLALAHFYENQGRLPDAQSVFSSLYQAHPNTLAVVRAATDFYWRSRQPARAIDILTESAGRAQPEYQRAFLLEGARKATEAGETPRARQILAALLKQDPYRAEYLSAMADTYARAGDDRGLRTFYQSTIDALRASTLSAAEKTERTAAMRRGLIPVLTRVRDFNAALDQYVEILNRYPDDAGLAKEAAAYAQAHNLGDRLVAFYTKQTGDAPKDYRWPIVLARIDTELERFSEALDAYAKATALRPERTDLWIAEGQLQERMLRFADAERSYTRLFDLTYRNSQWMEKVAEVRARQGQREPAIAALRTAYIENRPERPDNYFAVANKLNSWNYTEAARPFVEKGAEIAGAGLGNDFEAATTYARVLTRARQYDAAYRRLTASGAEQASELPAALRAMGETVRDYYTPEEKTAFAAYMEKARAPESRLELEAVRSAGLEDVTVRFLAALLRANPMDFDLQGQLLFPQRQRLRFGELASELETAWKATAPDTENRDVLLTRAAEAYRDAGDTAAELRVILLKKSHSGLDPQQSKRVCVLLAQQPRALAAMAANDPAQDMRDMAANCAIESGRPAESFAAINARGAGLPPVWTSAYTGLAGLYFAVNTPAVQTAFHDALGSMVVGDRIGKPVDRDRQLAGDVWFYYGARYGEYLTVTKQPNAGDFLPAMVEDSPGNAGAYYELAESYREAGDSQRAAARYADALELNAHRADAHTRMAELLWAAGRRDDAVKEWRLALEAYIWQQDHAGMQASFWSGVQALLADIGRHDLLAALQPEADRLLRTYLRRNGVYSFGPLLEGILAAAGDPAKAVGWLIELSRAANDPQGVLAFAVREPSIPDAQRDVLYQRLIEADQAKLASSYGEPRESAEASLRSWQIEWLRSLVERRQTERARTLLASIPEEARKMRLDQIVPLEMLAAAQANAIPALVARYAAQSEPLAAEILRNGASELKRNGEEAAARRVLEYLYSRELAAHNFDASNFLGLAEIRLEEKDPAAAVTLLRRMTMLAGAPFDTLTDAVRLLERFNRLEDAARFYEDRVKAVPWDAGAKEKLAEVQKNTSELTAAASDKQGPYTVRADAAGALRGLGGVTLNSGAAELDLLASKAALTEAAVNRPYWYQARLAAAHAAANAAAKIRLLEAAIAVNPEPAAPRIELFRTALDARRYRLAISSVASSANTPAYLPPDGEVFQPWLAEQFLQGMPLGSSERAAVARGLGEAYQRLTDPEMAIYFYRLSLELSRSQPERAALEKNLEAMRAAVRLRTANEQRRPVVTKNLEQPHVVRARLTGGGAL
jgi:tetratricopeptide (TPR) repeat protein